MPPIGHQVFWNCMELDQAEFSLLVSDSTVLRYRSFRGFPFGLPTATIARDLPGRPKGIDT